MPIFLFLKISNLCWPMGCPSWAGRSPLIVYPGPPPGQPLWCPGGLPSPSSLCCPHAGLLRILHSGSRCPFFLTDWLSFSCLSPQLEPEGALPPTQGAEQKQGLVPPLSQPPGGILGPAVHTLIGKGELRLGVWGESERGVLPFHAHLSVPVQALAKGPTPCGLRNPCDNGLCSLTTSLTPHGMPRPGDPPRGCLG